MTTIFRAIDANPAITLTVTLLVGIGFMTWAAARMWAAEKRRVRDQQPEVTRQEREPTINDWPDASVTALVDAVREVRDDELDRKADEYVGWLERRYQWSESGATTLLAVLLPTGLFVAVAIWAGVSGKW